MIIRPPDHTVPATQEALLQLREYAYQVAKAHGVAGGVTVLHWGPTRGENAGTWAPHVHIVGYLRGRYTPGPTEEGWTIIFKKVRGDGGLWKNVEALIYYELDHAVRWHEGEHHAITWFGSMAYNQFPNPDLEAMAAMGFSEPVGHLCPDCGGPLEPLEIFDNTNWPAERVGLQVYTGHEGPPSLLSSGASRPGKPGPTA